MKTAHGHCCARDDGKQKEQHIHNHHSIKAVITSNLFS